MDTNTDIKLQIWERRKAHCIPDARRAADWCQSMFEWLFGDAKQINFVEFNTEERRLKSELSSLLCSRISEFHEDHTTEFSKNPEEAHHVVEALFDALNRLYPMMLDDLDESYLSDPAATSKVEIMSAYPGFFAVVLYRIAHEIWNQGGKVVARLITEQVHSRTGIDIHPGAKIGERFVIDHGTGVVIGETTEIGSRVKIYQGVTLGALSVSKLESGVKRHPSIGNDAIIYANATILGGDTRVGEHAIVGGNVWLTQSIPDYAQVYHHAEIKIKNRRSDSLENQI